MRTLRLRSGDDRLDRDGQRLSSPIGPAGQITSLAELGLQLSCGATILEPASIHAGCGPTYLGYADDVAYNVPFGTPVANSPTSFKDPGPYFAPGHAAARVQRPDRIRLTATRRQPERHRHHEAPVHLRAQPVGVSCGPTATRSTRTGCRTARSSARPTDESLPSPQLGRSTS